MKIIEVTEAFNLGDFARNVGQDLMHTWTGVEKPGGRGWFEKPKTAPPPPDLARNLADAWGKIVIRVKANSRDPSAKPGDPPGVNDFTKIDRRQLSMAINKQLSELLNKETGGKIPNLAAINTIDTSKKINPTNLNSIKNQVSNELRAAINDLMTADPADNSGRAQVEQIWKKIVDNMAKITEIINEPDAEIYGLAGRKIDRDPATNAIRVDGRVLNPTLPADAQLINDIMAQGLNPP